MWGRHCRLTSFFLIADTRLSCEDIAGQSCVMVPRWQYFESCISSEPRAAHFRHVLRAAHWKYRMQKSHQKLQSGHHRTTLSGYMFATKAHIDNRKKKLVKQQYLVHMSPQYGELRPTSGWDRFGSLTNFNGFCVLAALLHGTVVVGFSQTLRRSTEGATYIQQGSHHVGHWPTFLVVSSLNDYVHQLPVPLRWQNPSGRRWWPSRTEGRTQQWSAAAPAAAYT